MKTVMKKMFCLLLVAVLLVSAVPAAFADEVKCATHDVVVIRQPAYDVPATCTTEGKVGYYCSEDGGHQEHIGVIPVVAHTPGAAATCTTAQTCTVCGTEIVAAKGHTKTPATCDAPETCSVCGNYWGTPVHSGIVEASCTEPKHCTVCNDTWGTAPGHTEVNDAAVAPTCSTPGKTAGKHCSVCNTVLVAQETVPALNHNYGSDNVCDVCAYCNNCGNTITNGDAKKHKTTCKFHPDFKKECTKCGTEYTALETHPTCDHCNNVYASSSNPCHATANCPYCLVCLEKEDYVKAHKTADHCAQCGNTDGTHKVTCPDAPNTGNALVRVHVRLHNGTTLIDTVELLTYRDDKGTQIGDSVSAHKSMILAELAEEYPEYSWGGNLYDDPGDSQDYNEKIGTGTTVYINAYAGQDMVLVYVHNGRTFSNLRIIQLEGKRRGDTVTKKEVTAAVSKYFNVSSLSMYSEDAWEDYVDGENVESVSSLKIPADDSYYVIDVKISGTAKSGTSGTGYSADSSNPKTGDDIFAPVMVLGLSASALAVLFYLNKKRAY